MLDEAPPLHVEASLQCQECLTVWKPSEATRWRAFLTHAPRLRVILYCPRCADREFGEFAHAAAADAAPA